MTGGQTSNGIVCIFRRVSVSSESRMRNVPAALRQSSIRKWLVHERRANSFARSMIATSSESSSLPGSLEGHGHDIDTRVSRSPCAIFWHPGISWLTDIQSTLHSTSQMIQEAQKLTQFWIGPLEKLVIKVIRQRLAELDCDIFRLQCPSHPIAILSQ